MSLRIICSKCQEHKTYDGETLEEIVNHIMDDAWIGNPDLCVDCREQVHLEEALCGAVKPSEALRHDNTR